MAVSGNYIFCSKAAIIILTLEEMDANHCAWDLPTASQREITTRCRSQPPVNAIHQGIPFRGWAKRVFPLGKMMVEPARRFF